MDPYIQYRACDGKNRQSARRRSNFPPFSAHPASCMDAFFAALL